jgi:hypothetical protein
VQLQDGSWTAVQGAEYTFAFWAKSSLEAGEVEVAAQAGSSRNYAYLGGQKFALTKEWTSFSYIYKADSVFGSDSVSFNIYCGGALGTYDFDNISLSVPSAALPRAAAVQAAGGFAICLLPEKVRCTFGDAPGSIGKITVRDLLGRVFFERNLRGYRVTSCDLPLPPSGLWIVQAGSGGVQRQRPIVIP